MTSLTADRLREVLSYSPESGQFIWLKTQGRAAAGSVAGAIHKYGYRVISVDRKGYGAHRLAWLYVHGEWPKEEIDHINGDRQDNCISNLRDVSPRVNSQNRKGPRQGKQLPLMGVRKATIGRQFTASINVGGRVIWLGGYDTPEAAHAAYMAAKKEMHQGAQAAWHQGSAA
jgi:hypothetical protein